MHIFRLRLVSVVAATTVTLGGCAIENDRNPATQIGSEPAGVALTITDQHGARIFRGTTPASVTLDTGGGYFDGRAYMIAVTVEGHAPQTVSLGTELNSWYIGNAASRAPIGHLVVDPLTGAMWKLHRQYAGRVPQVAGRPHRARVQVLALADIPVEARAAMVRIDTAGQETLPAGFSAADEAE